GLARSGMISDCSITMASTSAMEPFSTTKLPSIQASPSASSGLRRMRRAALAVVNLAATGLPVPSPQVNVSPFAVVKMIVPRRMGCLTAVAVRAVENLEAGKSPAQIFAGTCNACHKSPRGLLRSVPPSSLPGFLRQHYTTSSDMASVLASYLVANGATDTRSQGKEAKQGKDGAKEGAKEGRQEARAPADPGAR